MLIPGLSTRALRYRCGRSLTLALLIFALASPAQAAPAPTGSNRPAPPGSEGAELPGGELFPLPGSPVHEGKISCGPLVVSYSQSSGVRLWYDGVLISRQSSVAVVNSGWTHVYFNSEREPAVVSTGKGPSGAWMNVGARNDSFHMAYRIELTPTGTARVTLTGRLLKPVPAFMEYAASYLSADAVADRPFEAQTPAGRLTGTVPFAAMASDETAARLVPAFNSLDIDSRVGPLRIETDGKLGPFIIFDGRKNAQAWMRVWPIFWVGLEANQPLPTDNGFTTTLTWSFSGRARPRVTSLQLETGAPPPWRANTDVVEPYSAPPVLIPQPRYSHLGTGRIRLTPSTRIVASPDAENAARSLHDALLRLYGLDLPVVRPASGIAGGNAINLAIRGTPWGDTVASNGAVSPPDHSEGYAVRVSAGGAWACGRDAAGVYYAAQTLEELCGVDRDGVYLTQAEVADYPFSLFRGAHLFPSHEGLAFQEALIVRILGHFKLNKLVLESEYTRWDSHPELALPWSPTKHDLRDEIVTARRNSMEPIPLVQTLGHSEWMFKTGHHDDLKEDPKGDFAYDSTNPDTYRLVFDVFQEAIDLFHPKLFHIGHDEVTDRGRFPFRSLPKSVTDLFVEDTTRIHDWLQARGIGTMIWGDMLLAPGEADEAANAPSREEADRRRSEIPKDIIVTDWHYTGHRTLPSAGLLTGAGFKTVASTWFDPTDIQSFAWDSYVRGSLGLLQTTWAGYHPDAATLSQEFDQFTAFVLAADYAWSPRPDPPSQLPYDAADVFREAFRDTPVDMETHAGIALDLARVANLPLARTGESRDVKAMDRSAGSISAPSSKPHRDMLSPDVSSGASPVPDAELDGPVGRANPPPGPAPTDGFLGYSPEHSPSSIPIGQVRLNGTLFDLGPGVVALGGLLLPGQEFSQDLVIPIAEKVAELRFLAATGWTGNGGPVARAEITYADGATASLQFIAGQNIAPWTSVVGLPEASIAWRGATLAGDPVALRQVVWTNPSALKVVRSIKLHCLDPVAMPIFFGITAVAP